MSKIYRNFGVTTNLEEQDGVFQDVSVTGEKINIADSDIEILNRSLGKTKETDYRVGGKTHLRDQVFADFRLSGYTEKLSNFYADTFFELSKTQNRNPTDYYTLVKETETKFEYKIKDDSGNYQSVTKEKYDTTSGNEFDSTDNYKKIKELIHTEKQDIRLNSDTLEIINSTLPTEVRFKVEQTPSTNKQIDPFIRT